MLYLLPFHFILHFKVPLYFHIITQKTSALYSHNIALSYHHSYTSHVLFPADTEIHSSLLRTFEYVLQTYISHSPTHNHPILPESEASAPGTISMLFLSDTSSFQQKQKANHRKLHRSAYIYAFFSDC